MQNVDSEKKKVAMQSFLGLEKANRKRCYLEVVWISVQAALSY